jgi:hypothetical protein
MFTPFKTIVRNLAKIATGLVFGVSVMSAANAQVPKPINPMSLASLPYEQRLAHIKARNAILLKLTPQERQAFREERAKMMAAMSPAEKQALQDKINANRAAMTPEQKAAIRAENQAFFNALPADEREKNKASTRKSQ